MDIENFLYPPRFGVSAIPLSQNDPGFVLMHFEPSEGKDFCIQLSLSLTALIHMTNGESRNKDWSCSIWFVWLKHCCQIYMHVYIRYIKLIYLSMLMIVHKNYSDHFANYSTSSYALLLSPYFAWSLFKAKGTANCNSLTSDIFRSYKPNVRSKSLLL